MGGEGKTDLGDLVRIDERLDDLLERRVVLVIGNIRVRKPLPHTPVPRQPLPSHPHPLSTPQAQTRTCTL